MALNLKRIKQEDQERKDRMSGNFLSSKDLTEDGVEFRISEPSEAMNGLYYVEQIGYFIDKKFYQSNETFGGDDVIGEEIEAAKAEGDKEVLALLNRTLGKGQKAVSKAYKYLIPGAKFKVKEGGDPDALEDLVPDKGTMLDAKLTLLNAISDILTNKMYQVKSGNGITCRDKGRTLLLKKTGEGLNTKYSAVAFPDSTSIDAKFQPGGSEYVDPIEAIQKAKCDDAHLRSVIRNYLYGEDIVPNTAAPEPATKAEKPSKKDTATTSKKTSRRSLSEDVVTANQTEDEDDDLND